MSETLTRPPARAASAQVSTTTHPRAISARALLSAELADVQSGVASEYWLELLAYPAGSARSLWLLVNGAWKRRDNPTAGMQDVVQRAFLGSGSNVRVWFDGELVVGLVVDGA
jgi:hypothetical protein